MAWLSYKLSYILGSLEHARILARLSVKALMAMQRIVIFDNYSKATSLKSELRYASSGEDLIVDDSTPIKDKKTGKQKKH